MQRTRGGDIVVGDLIVAIDGKTVSSPANMLSMLDEHEIGDQVNLTVLREGKRLAVPIQLQGQLAQVRQ
jgi:S1-C subfamily serine protease